MSLGFDGIYFFRQKTWFRSQFLHIDALMNHGELPFLPQSGPLPGINGIIAPINGLVNG